jgi:hypothetical protein
MSARYLALRGVARCVRILRHIDESLAQRTRMWIALTRFNERWQLAREVRGKLIEYFPDAVLPRRSANQRRPRPTMGGAARQWQKRDRRTYCLGGTHR